MKELQLAIISLAQVMHRMSYDRGTQLKLEAIIDALDATAEEKVDALSILQESTRALNATGAGTDSPA